MEVFVCMSEIVFGRAVSNQIKSRNRDADFWLTERPR